MKDWMKWVHHAATAVCAAAVLMANTGCQTTGTQKPHEPTEDAPTALQAGEALTITYTDVLTQLAPFEGRIKEDGTITLMENQEFKASGKTTGQLEKEIRDRYVPRYFVKMTVTVKSQDRFFYVNGYVRMPGRYEYRGDITVSGAIAAAGGFDPFAKKTKVRILRANNKTVVVNMEKAVVDPKLDLPIYPRDRIEVPRKDW